MSSHPSPFPSGTLVYSDSSKEITTSSQLSELDMIREATIKLHAELKEIIKNLKNKVEQEHRRFEAISAPADTLQGYLPLMQLAIPVFVVKIGQGEGRYGVIPPLLVEEEIAGEYQMKMFDEVFGEQLIQLLRTEIRTNPLFRQNLDNIAQTNNWVRRPFSAEHVQRGTRQLANYNLLSYQTREQISTFWSSILEL